MKTRIVIALLAAVCLVTTVSCTLRRGEVGSEKNPVQLWFMPLKDEAVFKTNAPIIEKFLEEATGLSVETKLASSFIDIVKAFGKKKADVAFMNTLGYLLSNDWSKTQPLLQYTYGDLYRTYSGEIIARVGSVSSPADLNGKSIAFVDPYSAAGYLYALKYLKDSNIKPSKMEFAGGHIAAVEMVYRGDVDAAAAYHEHPGAAGEARDARAELLAKYPDIVSVVKIVALTDAIPNGPLAVRHDLNAETVAKLQAAFQRLANTPEGRKALMDLYNITGLERVDPNVYTPVGNVIREVGKTIQEMVPGGAAYFKTWIMPGLE